MNRSSDQLVTSSHSKNGVILVHKRIIVYLFPLEVFSPLLRVFLTPGIAFNNSVME